MPKMADTAAMNSMVRMVFAVCCHRQGLFSADMSWSWRLFVQTGRSD